jgi:mRNA turnover protein 4
LTKVSKKTKEHKNAMMTEVGYLYFVDWVHIYLSSTLQLQANSEKWRYCWLFDVGSMRNAHLKTVRNLWKEYALHLFAKKKLKMAYVLLSVQLGYSLDEEQWWQRR